MSAGQLLTVDDQLREARARLKLARARAELRRLEGDEFEREWHGRRLEESYWGFTGTGFGAYVDPSDAFRDPDLRGFGSPLLPAGAGRYDRLDGRNRPFIWYDIDLDWMRSQSRWIATRNPLGAGVLRRLTNFAIRKGYVYEARPAEPFAKDTATRELAAQVERVLHEFRHLNGWAPRERSAFLRSRRDGEVFLRHFAQPDGTTLVRFVEPEQVRQPPGTDVHHTFGVHTDPADIECRIAYDVSYTNPEDWESVPAEDVSHLALNVDECVKRGISDFFCTGAAVEETWKLLRNLRVVAGVQAAVPWIEEFENASQVQVSAYVDSKKDQARPVVTNPITGRTPNYRTYEPGEIPHIGRGRKYIDQPSAANAPNHIQVVQAGLRAVAARWDMTEAMISGDASNNNYASILAAGSPFVTGIECEQAVYEAFFLRSMWIAVRNAARAGRFTLGGRRVGEHEVSRRIDVHATPPQVAIANKQEEADVDHKDIAAGVMSIQTRRAKVGLKDEQERENLKEEPPKGDGQGQNPAPQQAGGTPEQTPAPQAEPTQSLLGGNDPDDDPLEDWLIGLEEALLFEAGFTGTKQVQWGGKTQTWHYVNGKRVSAATAAAAAGHGGVGAGTPPATPPGPPAAPPAKKPTPKQQARANAQQALSGHLAKFRAGQALTAAEFQAMPGHLAQLTVPELKAARAALGLSAGAKRVKADHVNRLLGYAQLRVQSPPTPPSPAPPAPTPPPAPANPLGRGANVVTGTPATGAAPSAPSGSPPPPRQTWETGKPQPGVVVNGVPFTSAPPKFWEKTKDVDVGEPPPLPGKKINRVGILIQEPDGRVWICQPTNSYGNRKHTWPGGGVEPGLTDQQNALKEVWEETGLQCEITGHLGDFEDSNNGNNGRLYIGRRIGGAPWDAKVEDGKHGPVIRNNRTGQFAAESEAVDLVTPEAAAKLLHRTDDLAQLMTVHPIAVNTPTRGKGSEPLKKFLAAIRPRMEQYKKEQKAKGQYHGVAELHVVQQMRGFNGKPKVVSKKSMDALLAKGEHVELLRGMAPTGGKTGDELAEQYRSGDHFPGHGVFGCGTYADGNKGYANVARTYAGHSGAVIRIALPKTAKVIKASELEKMVATNPEAFKGYRATGGKLPEEDWLGVQAALAGYDAIEVDGKSKRHGAYGKGFYSILNRSILVVQKESARGHVIP